MSKNKRVSRVLWGLCLVLMLGFCMQFGSVKTKAAVNKDDYSIKENVLYHKKQKIKTLPEVDNLWEGWRISAGYGSRIFLSRENNINDEDKKSVSTYSYDTKTKKLKKLKDDCNIMDICGRYVVASSWPSMWMGSSNYPVTLYKITSSGLKKIKKLGDEVRGTVFDGNKLYYGIYPDISRKQGSLCRCNPDGSGNKVIKTFSSEEGYVVISPVNSRYCEVWIDGYNYRYTIKTGKLKKLKS